jgi:hypothetical protein
MKHSSDNNFSLIRFIFSAVLSEEFRHFIGRDFLLNYLLIGLQRFSCSADVRFGASRFVSMKRNKYSTHNGNFLHIITSDQSILFNLRYLIFI